MKRIAALIPALSVLTLGLTLALSGCASVPSHPTAAALVQQAAPAASAPVVVNCSLKPQVRPSWFILTCADAGDDLSGLHWVSWGSSSAFGTGTEQVNDCTPNCASGKFVDYPVLVALWRPGALPGHPGQHYFTRITRVYTANRPPLYYCSGTRTCYPQTATTDLWS
jgi:hypothetical protein